MTCTKSNLAIVSGKRARLKETSDVVAVVLDTARDRTTFRGSLITSEPSGDEGDQREGQKSGAPAPRIARRVIRSEPSGRLSRTP